MAPCPGRIHGRRRECDERRRDFGRLGLHDDRDRQLGLFRCQRRHGADNRGVGLRGDGGVYGGDGQRDWRRGGAISLSVGDGNTGAGGAVTVTAGKTTADSAAGGALTLTAGIGDGSSGAVGGAVSIAGGVGANTGGAVSVTSGVGTSDDSGSMTIATANSGSSGESGNMTVSTGSATSGVSGGIAVSRGLDLRHHRRGQHPHSDASGGSAGDISFTTGDATGGAGGSISFTFGSGDVGDGGGRLAGGG